MKIGGQSCYWRLSAAISGALVIFTCGCASLPKGNYAGFKISSEGSAGILTNKIKLYVLPRYGRIKNDSPEWKMYDDLARYSVRLLEENRDCIVDNAGYVNKDAIGKTNAVKEIFSAFNPAVIARDFSGLELDWQEKLIMNFIAKEFSQGDKDDSLILCLYTQPRYPCKEAGSLSPYYKPGAAPVYSAGVSELELGYILVDPVEKTIAKRRKVILTRGIEMDVEPQAKKTNWKFREGQSVFLENAAVKLFDEFPMVNRRKARGIARESHAPAASSSTPTPAEGVSAPVQHTTAPAQGDNVYLQLAQWRADKAGRLVKIELLDGPQWLVTIDLKGAAYEKIGYTLDRRQDQGNWVNCFVKDGFFYGRGGKTNLEEILTTFLTWLDNFAKTNK
jgi:hypothetical protein